MTEYKLSFTAKDIDEKLGKIDEIDTLKNLVGETSVSEQISDALENVAVETDTTLSISGKAADAKITGDAIAEINSKIFTCLTQEEYDALKVDGKLNENTPYLIIEG